MAIMPHARAKTEPPATRHPPPATRHPPPATRNPPPATRGKVLPGWEGYLNLPRHPPAPERDPVDESVSGVSSERSLSITDSRQNGGSMVDKCLVSFAGLSSTCD